MYSTLQVLAVVGSGSCEAADDIYSQVTHITDPYQC